MFGIINSYCKVDYPITTSTNDFEIVPADVLPNAIS